MIRFEGKIFEDDMTLVGYILINNNINLDQISRIMKFRSSGFLIGSM